VTEVYEAALAAYDAGLMPIPLRRDAGQRKRPALPTWRQYQVERPSRDVIEEWFNGNDHNLGIITGKVSGLVVLDLDGKIYDPTFWLAGHGFNVRTPIVSTGRGGAHVYYKHPGGVVPNGVKLREIDGVSLDVRADGGYVVAPPSLHDSGALYEWANGDFSWAPAPFPPELMAVLNRVTEYGTVGIKASDFLAGSDILRAANRGERNHRAAQVSGYWLKVTSGDEDAAWHGLVLWNNQNTPPLPTSELRQTFESIARRERQVSVSLEVESESAAGDPLPVMDGQSWADTVRHLPPRQGTPASSVPGLEEVGGLVPRDLIILAGRPGMGKSTCAWNLVSEVVLQGPQLPTVIFSTEMTANDVARWMGARLFQKGTPLDASEWAHTLDLISRSPVSVCDAGAVTADQIVEIVKSRPDTRLVIVDHIQRVVSGKAMGDNRNLEVGRTAQLLKSLAKDVGCTVIALSQMNRASDQLGQPRLSSLRDSGEIEQEADAVIFVWTKAEDITVPDLDVQFYLAKNRHGALAHIDCKFLKAQKTFRRLSLDGEYARLRHEQAYKERVNEISRSHQ